MNAWGSMFLKVDQIVVLAVFWKGSAGADKKWLVAGLPQLVVHEELLRGSGQIAVFKIATWP